MINKPKNYSEEEIMQLLKQDAYYYIQHIDLTNDHCMMAVKSDGLSLKFIPKRNQTKEICMSAVRRNTRAIKYVSKKFLDEELYIAAALSDEPYLGYIPKKYLTQEICDIAVSKRADAISNVPYEYQTMELRKAAVVKDWRTLGLIDKRKRSKKLCMMAYKYDVEAIKYFPEKILTKELCEEAVMIEPLLSIHVPNRFLTESIRQALVDRETEDSSYIPNIIEETEQDERFYEKYVSSSVDLLDLTPSVKYELIAPESILHEADVDGGFDNGLRSIYYISDIHLNHKIHKKFPNGATELEIRSYIESVVDRMLSGIAPNEYSIINDDFLLIIGDVSFDYKISEIFYRQIAMKWDSQNVIITLGNHELWNYSESTSLNMSQSLDNILDKYRSLFKKLGMNFLENNLLTVTYDFTSPYGKLICLSEREIFEYSKEQLREICSRSSLIVFGGVGFSGMNEEFNALNGIYRNTINSRNDEILLSQKTKNIYDRLIDTIGDYKVIVQSHMPFTDWNNDDYHSGWIYVHGHNHRNEFYISKEKTVFADNQIGYDNPNITLKRFSLTSNYDLFHDWADGIYAVSREEYLDFCKGLGISLDFNRRDGEIKMLKRDGLYLFMYRNNNGRLYLLKGGRLTKVGGKFEYQFESYYYNNMVSFGYAIKNLFEKYDTMLKRLSDYVRTFGGRGTVHGCIIDIDFYNHLYLNPIDGKVVPYYALSKYEKWVYKDVKSLLLENCPELIDKYLETTKGNVPSIEHTSVEEYAVALATYVPETDMYEPSRIIRSFQYLREVNVIREWDDKWVQNINNMRIENVKIQLGNEV